MLVIHRALTSTLFPYTTLFRSRPAGAPMRSLVTLFVFLATGIAALPALADSPSIEFGAALTRSEEHTSELQSLRHLVCRLLLEKKKDTEEERNACRLRIRREAH